LPAAVGFSATVPLIVSLPAQLPLAVQAVALVEVQVKVLDAPSVRLVGAAVSVTVGAGASIVSVWAVDTLGA
jgi:hypothetical protein